MATAIYDLGLFIFWFYQIGIFLGFLACVWIAFTFSFEEEFEKWGLLGGAFSIYILLAWLGTVFGWLMFVAK